jgi:hypothetical protein
MKNLTLFLVLITALLGLRPAVQAQSTCVPPTNISVTTPSASSAVVNFTPVASAASYTVRYWWVADTTASGAQTVTVAAPPATITGLQYPAYRVTVTSNCTATTGATSAPVVFQFPFTGCGTPSNVLATATSTTTATVTYAAVSGASSYIIQALVAGTNIVAVNTTSTTTTASLTGLLPNTVYLARVYAVCASGTSAGFGTISFGTGSNGTVCDSVHNLHVSSITSTSAVVSYNAVSSNATYTIQYALASNPTALAFVTTNATSVTLAGLQANQSYLVQVRTNCSATSTSAMPGRTFHTLAPAVPCGAVTNVVITATSDSTASVSFTPGANNTSFHIIYYVLNDSSHWVNTNASPATIAGLIPGNTYYVQVTSICGTATGSVYTGGSNVTFGFRGTSALGTHTALGVGTFDIYPNPAHHTLSLMLPAVPGATKAQVLLLNAIGQQVRVNSVALSAAATHAQLDLTGVAPGLYTVRVLAGGQAASQRLVVE